MWKKDPCLLPTGITKDGEREGLGQIGDFVYQSIRKNKQLMALPLFPFLWRVLGFRLLWASQATSKATQGCLTPACQTPGISNGKDQINVACIN